MSQMTLFTLLINRSGQPYYESDDSIYPITKQIWPTLFMSLMTRTWWECVSIYFVALEINSKHSQYLAMDTYFSNVYESTRFVPDGSVSCVAQCQDLAGGFLRTDRGKRDHAVRDLQLCTQQMDQKQQQKWSDSGGGRHDHAVGDLQLCTQQRDQKQQHITEGNMLMQCQISSCARSKRIRSSSMSVSRLQRRETCSCSARSPTVHATKGSEAAAWVWADYKGGKHAHVVPDLQLCSQQRDQKQQQQQVVKKENVIMQCQISSCARSKRIRSSSMSMSRLRKRETCSCSDRSPTVLAAKGSEAAADSEEGKRLQSLSMYNYRLQGYIAVWWNKVRHCAFEAEISPQ